MGTFRILAAAGVIGLYSVGPGAAQAAGAVQADEHAHHKMAMTAPAPVAAAHVMEVQPSIGDLTLTDQNGRSVRLRDAVSANEPVMVNFIFTSCTTICPVMSAGFASLQGRLKARQQGVRLVSISIDPEVDTPARLKVYADGLAAGENWVFLTGTPSDAEAAQRAFGTYRGTKESHSAATFIRRALAGPWEQLDGLVSGETLLRAYRGGDAVSAGGRQ